LSYVVGAILLVDIGKDFVAAVVLKIKVNIRELAAFDIQESFEDKSVCQRVDIRDVQTIKGQTGGSTSADTEIDALSSGKGDYVPDNQEVVGKLCLLDDIKLVRKPFPEL
jgi:hypothetical protein